MTPQTHAETVTFRLKDAVAVTSFADAASAMIPFLRGTGAMVSRELSADGTGVWTEHVVWSRKIAAKKAATRTAEHTQARPFLDMIIPAGTCMHHATIHLYGPPK